MDCAGVSHGWESLVSMTVHRFDSHDLCGALHLFPRSFGCKTIRILLDK